MVSGTVESTFLRALAAPEVPGAPVPEVFLPCLAGAVTVRSEAHARIRFRKVVFHDDTTASRH